MRAFKINKFQLDEEAVTVPHDFYNAAKAEEEWCSKRDMAKAQLDTLKEKVGLEVRSLDVTQINEKYKLHLSQKMLTEAAVNALINKDKEIESKQREYLEAKRTAGTYKVQRQAFEKKYGMIDTLSYLHNSGWFMKDSHDGTRPSLPRSTSAPRSLRERAKEVGTICDQNR